MAHSHAQRAIQAAQAIGAGASAAHSIVQLGKTIWPMIRLAGPVAALL